MENATYYFGIKGSVTVFKGTSAVKRVQLEIKDPYFAPVLLPEIIVPAITPDESIENSGTSGNSTDLLDDSNSTSSNFTADGNSTDNSSETDSDVAESEDSIDPSGIEVVPTVG